MAQKKIPARQCIVYLGGDRLLKAALQRLLLFCLCKAGGIRAEVSTAAGLLAHGVDADLSAGCAHHTHQFLLGAAGQAADALAQQLASVEAEKEADRDGKEA